jgi:hypothetical protein
MKNEARLKAAERAVVAQPDPAQIENGDAIREYVAGVLADPVRLAQKLRWDEENLGDPADVGVANETTKAKDRAAIALLASEASSAQPERIL